MKVTAHVQFPDTINAFGRTWSLKATHRNPDVDWEDGSDYVGFAIYACSSQPLLEIDLRKQADEGRSWAAMLHLGPSRGALWSKASLSAHGNVQLEPLMSEPGPEQAASRLERETHALLNVLGPSVFN